MTQTGHKHDHKRLTDNIISHTLLHTHTNVISVIKVIGCAGMITVIGTIQQLSSPPSRHHGNDDKGARGESWEGL